MPGIDEGQADKTLANQGKRAFDMSQGWPDLHGRIMAPYWNKSLFDQ
jgi:hypothetical protein